MHDPTPIEDPGHPYRLLVVANETLAAGTAPVTGGRRPPSGRSQARGARRRARALRVGSSGWTSDDRPRRAAEQRLRAVPGGPRRPTAYAPRASSATTTRCSRSRMRSGSSTRTRSSSRLRRARSRASSRSTSSSASGTMRDARPARRRRRRRPRRDRGVRCGGLHSRFTGGSQSRPRAAWCH